MQAVRTPVRKSVMETSSAVKIIKKRCTRSPVAHTLLISSGDTMLTPTYSKTARTGHRHAVIWTYCRQHTPWELMQTMLAKETKDRTLF